VVPERYTIEKTRCKGADMDLAEEQEEGNTDEYRGDPYVIRRVSSRTKAVKIAAAWSVPLLLAIVFSRTATANDRLAQLTWLPLFALGLAIWYTRKVWSAAPVRVLATVKHPIKAIAPVKKVVNSTVLLSIVCVLLAYAERHATDSTAYFVFGWPIALYLGYLVMLFRPQYSEAYTPAAKEEYARLEQEKAVAKQLEENKNYQPTWMNVLAADLWSLWYVRYFIGALLILGAVELGSAGGKDSWILVSLVGICGLACMKEIVLWGIGLAVCGGLLYAAVGALAGIPISVAIIIGALIIANSRNR
jgi:hypothetical protein